MRRQIRTWALWAVGTLLLFIASSVGGEFIVRLADKWGWYENPTGKLASAMSWAYQIATHATTLWVAGLFAGFAAGVWLDWFIKSRERHQSAAPGTSLDVQEDDLNAQRDVTVQEAIAYVAFREWGHEFYDVVSSPQYDGAKEFDEFIQYAADNDLPIWGRQRALGVLEPIWSNYWHEYTIDWFSLLNGKPFTKIIQQSMPNKIVFRDLMTSRAAMEAIWPPKPIS